MKIIDSHMHIWNFDKVNYEWPTPNEPEIYRNIEFEEIKDSLKIHGVDEVVLVQAFDSDTDTNLMLEAANMHDEIIGVVAYLPLDKPALCRKRLAELSNNKYFCGARALIHDMANPLWLMQDSVRESLAMLAKAQVPFDVIAVLPEHRHCLISLARALPELTFVLDHLGHAPVGSANASWSNDLAEIATLPNVVAKISGLYPVVGDMKNWSLGDLRDVFNYAIELFGPERLMFGSDWPVSILAGGYGRVFGALSELICALGDESAQKVFYGNAKRVYGL